MTDNNTLAVVGILLAAGRGRRFDAGGARNKLLQPLPGGAVVVAQAARNLQQALAINLAVVPAAAPLLTAQLTAVGVPVTVCAAAASGMAASLTHGLRATAGADAWLIALADMPFVRVETMRRLASALAAGAGIVVPVCGGRRGNPVGFGRQHLPRLLQLTGDAGARQLLQRYPVTEIAVEDDGIFQDIDTVPDWQQAWAARKE